MAITCGNRRGRSEAIVDPPFNEDYQMRTTFMIVSKLLAVDVAGS